MIEDNEGDFALLDRSTRDYNCNLIWEPNPQAAIERIQREKYDWVLLDPGIAGTEDATLFRKIREASPDVDIIIFSGLLNSPSVLRITQSGFAFFAEKPPLDQIEPMMRAMRIKKKVEIPKIPSLSEEFGT